MDIRITSQTIQEVQGDALIVGATRSAGAQGKKSVLLSPSATAVDKALEGLIDERCADGEFRGSSGEILTIHPMGRLPVKRVVVVGLGSQESITAQSLQRASATALRHLQSTGAHSIVLTLQGNSANYDDDLGTQALLEGALLGLYTFRHYQRSDSDGKGIAQLTLLTDAEHTADVERAVQKARIMAEATNFARDLVNEPPSVLTPTEMANRARAMAQQYHLECEVFDKAKMEELGMGGLLAVTRGSEEPPRFIILRYRGAPESSEKGLALVGKGITFDSGGLSLKTAEGMERMKGDMAGAAAVLGAMQAIGALKPHINVTALVPTCENMPSGTAFHPGDVLRIMNGKTIEILNTDAEGRLILADALSYAVKEGLSPIIDLATLTGAIVVALGNVMAGLFSNDELLTDEIIAAGRATGEKYWPMPLDTEYDDLVKSEIADVRQTGGRAGGSIVAAKVLENFVGETRWAHLDIAGMTYRDSKRPYQEMGATGFGVRTLAELALRLAQ